MNSDNGRNGGIQRKKNIRLSERSPSPLHLTSMGLTVRENSRL
ncbi:hypothetical protein HMPREF1549_01701 [Actinomyces johnsonii F0510]|uniref:Uncharacterized protein n=1 Tax=Actinomyces johnsonii F0510 TaxID=1227262 RepID=U1PQU7_9ACTO|nr:hypothetical protein HMPREF1549_01701 [Actinomyces johnsonii F0510]